jgi:hypothetical protein
MQTATGRKKEMERAVADLPTYKAGDAAGLAKSELISWRVGKSATHELVLGDGELGDTW